MIEPDGHIIQTRHVFHPEDDWPEGFSDVHPWVADLVRPDPSVHLFFIKAAPPWVYAYWVTSTLTRPAEVEP